VYLIKNKELDVWGFEGVLYYSIVYQINDLIISTLTFIENVAPQSVRTRLKKVTISAMQLNVAPT